MKKHTRREFLGKSLVGAIGAGAALSGLDALGLLAQKPARPMAGAQQMTADGRAFTAGRYAVLLDGGIAGWVQSVEGGHAAADDVASGGLAQRKHIAGVKYEDITVSCGTGMSKPMYEWIKASFDRKYMRKDGAIHTCDYDGNIVSTLEFFHGLITEVGFPALDAASKDAAKMTIKISPETARMVEKRGGKLPAPGAMGAKQKKWMAANFRLEIAGLDCTRVNKVEAITIKQKVVENPVGEMRAVMKEPAKLEFPNLAFTVPEQNAAALVAWHKESAMRTRPGNHKPGKLVFLAADGREELFTLTFHDLGISKLTPDNSGAGRDAVRRLKAEMYCEKMEFEYGDAAVS